MEKDLARKILIRYLPELTQMYRKDKDRHDYYQRTIAIEMPTVAELQAFMQIPDFKHVMYLKFAEAKKHPKEPFVKKEGRNLVLERLAKAKPMELRITQMHLNTSAHELTFTYRAFYTQENGPSGYGEGFTFKLKNGKVYFVGENL